MVCLRLCPIMCTHVHSFHATLCKDTLKGSASLCSAVLASLILLSLLSPFSSMPLILSQSLYLSLSPQNPDQTITKISSKIEKLVLIVPAFVVLRFELCDWRSFVQHSFHVELRNALQELTALAGVSPLEEVISSRSWPFLAKILAENGQK